MLRVTISPATCRDRLLNVLLSPCVLTRLLIPTFFSTLIKAHLNRTFGSGPEGRGDRSSSNSWGAPSRSPPAVLRGCDVGGSDYNGQCQYGVRDVTRDSRR